MSVLRSKRNISKTEYENTFTDLYRFSMKNTTNVPKRRRKWLCPNIDLMMNVLYRDIMSINTSYFVKEEKKGCIEVIAKRCINNLLSLEKPLMIMWNVQNTRINHMAAWVDLINKEIQLLSYMCAEEVHIPKVMILDYKAINSVEFLKNMSELHRYTHSKVTNAYAKYDDTQGALMISLVNDAFYYLIAANKCFPKSKAEYEKRREYISKSISCLKSMNRQMIFYFNLMRYSERIMREWSDMLTDELKLLNGLQKSDSKRFGSLE